MTTYTSSPDRERLLQRIAELERIVDGYTESAQRATTDESRFRRITANVPGMVYQFALQPDGTAHFPYASDGCRDLFDIEPRALAADAGALVGLIHPDDLAGFQQSVASSAATLTPWNWEGRFVLASGMIKWVQAASRPEQLTDGTILWDGLLLDISARVQTEMALQASDLRFQRMTANIPGMVFQFLLRTDGQIEWPFISEGCLGLYGATAAEIQANSTLPVEAVHPSDLESFQTSVAESAATLAPWSWEGRIYSRAGDMRWVQAASRPERQSDGAIRWDGLLLDITLRKQAEEALRQRSVQDETIRVQAAILDELSTPLLPISDEVVVMPLIGAVDSRRAQQVVETLLHGVQSHHARIAILDITGVLVVDTSVAKALMEAADAVRLLGAEVVLTGIRPEVAQTLVGLGVQVLGMETRGSLQSGIAYALARSAASRSARLAGW